MDLIYEGITTSLSGSFSALYFVCQNGPDLRRDYDPISLRLMGSKNFLVRMDLIYEGITTAPALWQMPYTVCSSEWTWFTKGLRHLPNLNTSSPVGQNGPDLRRDYDLNLSVSWRRCFSSEWTWFTKGLRRIYLFDLRALGSSEWTWFTKGLRLRTRPPLYLARQ